MLDPWPLLKQKIELYSMEYDKETSLKSSLQRLNHRLEAAMTEITEVHAKVCFV